MADVALLINNYPHVLPGQSHAISHQLADYII